MTQNNDANEKGALGRLVRHESCHSRWVGGWSGGHKKGSCVRGPEPTSNKPNADTTCTGRHTRPDPLLIDIQSHRQAPSSYLRPVLVLVQPVQTHVYKWACIHKKTVSSCQSVNTTTKQGMHTS